MRARSVHCFFEGLKCAKVYLLRRSRSNAHGKLETLCSNHLRTGSCTEHAARIWPHVVVNDRHEPARVGGEHLCSNLWGTKVTRVPNGRGIESPTSSVGRGGSARRLFCSPRKKSSSRVGQQSRDGGIDIVSGIECANDLSEQQNRDAILAIQCSLGRSLCFHAFACSSCRRSHAGGCGRKVLRVLGIEIGKRESSDVARRATERNLAATSNRVRCGCRVERRRRPRGAITCGRGASRA